MPHSPRIERATPESAPAFAALNAVVHEPHLEAHPTWFRATDLDELTATYRAWLERDDVAAFLALDPAGHAVGTLLTKLHDHPPTPFHPRRRYLEIDQIVVAPTHRRRGLGHALVETARAEARVRAVDTLHLATWSFNEGAQAFFEGEGFVPRCTRYWQPA